MRTDDMLKDSIVFFSNNGKIISKAQYKEIDKVFKFQLYRLHYLISLKMNNYYYLKPMDHIIL